MRLRTRLTLTIVLLGLPLILGVDILRQSMAGRLQVRAVVQLAQDHMDAGGWDLFADDPTSFGGPLRDLLREPRSNRPGPLRRRPPRGGAGPGRPRPPRHAPRADSIRPPPEPTLWVLDADFVPTNREARPLPAELRRQLDADTLPAHHPVERGGTEQGLDVVYRTANPSAPYVWITRWDRAGAATSALDADNPSLLLVLAGGLILVSLCAAWPLVRRVRSLTVAVQRSAASQYAAEVPPGGRDEFGDLARAFNTAGQEIRTKLQSLQERSESLRRFLANTTHDVMTPLTVLQGELGAIQRQLSEGQEVAPQTLRACQEEAHYMASLLHNLTAVARLESGAVALHQDPLDLRQLVERAASRHRGMANSRGLQLELAVPEQPVPLVGDVTLLEQAVSNLIHNAVRYNTTGQHIAVVLELERTSSGATASSGSPVPFALRVVDDGPGVDPAHLGRLGQRRFRSPEARNRSPEGQGLGLDIAQQAAVAHGLTLRFATPPDGGFEVILEGHTQP